MRTGDMRARLAVLVAIALALPVLAVGLSEGATAPSITLSTGHALVGDTVQLQGDNFPKMTTGSLLVGNTQVAIVQTGRYGHFSGSFKVPPVAGGPTTVAAVVGAVRVAVPFTIDTVSSASVQQPVVRSTTTAHGGATLVTPAFDAAAGDIIVVGVSSDGPSTTPQSMTVSGAGLSWNLAIRGNAQPGSAEVWYAVAPSALSNATLTTKQGVALGSQFVDVSVISGARGIGAVQSESAVTSHPTASVRTVDNSSLVLGVANDWTRPSQPTVGTGEVLLSSFTDKSTGDTYWAQADGHVLPAGSLSTLDATLPTSDRVNLAIAEVLADGGATQVTPPPTTTTTPTSTTTTPTTSPSTTTTTPPPTDPNQPDATSTGYRSANCPGGLKLVSGNVAASSDVSCEHITGDLSLKVHGLHVTDSWIEKGIDVTWRGGNGMNGQGAVIDHVELGTSAVADNGGDAIGDSDYTLTYSNVHNFEDGIRANSNTYVAHNYVHDLYECSGCHNDGLQGVEESAGPVTVLYNTIENSHGQTSAVGIGNDTGPCNYPIDVENNWLAGGGFTLYPSSHITPATAGCTITYKDNIVSRKFYPNGGYYGPVYSWNNATTTHSGNHFTDGQSID